MANENKMVFTDGTGTIPSFLLPNSSAGTVNIGTTNNLAYYQGNGTAVSPFVGANNGAVFYNGSGALSSGALPVISGGTGQTTYTKGDLLVASNSTTLNKLTVGTDTFVLTADSTQASGVKWAASSGGVTNLNTLTAATQTFATGTAGTNFAISSTGSTHTFNIPDASATNRGLVTTGTQTIAGAKTFNTQVAVNRTGTITSYLEVEDTTGVGALYLRASAARSASAFYGAALYASSIGSADGTTASFNRSVTATSGFSQVAGVLYANSSAVETNVPIALLSSQNASSTTAILRLDQRGTGDFFQAYDGTSVLARITKAGNISATNLSGVNTGDETNSSIITKIGFTPQTIITGGATTITSSNLTTSRALTSDTNGKVTASGVTSTELGYLSGVNGTLASKADLVTRLNGKVEVTIGTSAIADYQVTGNFSTAWNAALAAIASAPFKKIVILGDGTFNLDTTLTPPSYCEVEIREGAILTNSVAGNNIFLITNDYVWITGRGTINLTGTASAIRSQGHEFLQIKDIKLTGNSTPNFGAITLHGGTATRSMNHTTIDNVLFDQYQSARCVGLYAKDANTITHLTIKNCTYNQTHPLSCRITALAAVKNIHIYNNKYYNLINIPGAAVDTTYSTVIYGGDDAANQISDIFVYNNYFYSNEIRSHGFANIYSYKNVRISGNKAEVPPYCHDSIFFAPGRSVNPGYSAIVTNNEIVNYGAPMDFDASVGFIFSNNIVDGCTGTGPVLGYSNTAGQHFLKIDSNIYTNYQGSATFKTAILLANASHEKSQLSNNLIASPYGPNLFASHYFFATQTITITQTGQYTFGHIGITSSNTSTGTITSSDGTGTATGHGTATFGDGGKVTITVTTPGTFVFTVSGTVREGRLTAGTSLSCCNAENFISSTGNFDHSDNQIFNNRLKMPLTTLLNFLVKQNAANKAPVMWNNEVEYLDPTTGNSILRVIDPVQDNGSSTGSITLKPSDCAVQTTMLTGNITLTLVAGNSINQKSEIRFVQDVTGGRSITMPGNFVALSGNFKLNTASNAKTSLFIYWDGANWVEYIRSATTLGQLVNDNNYIRTLFQQNTQVAAAGTTETTLATYTIPADTIGANGSIRITTLIACTNNGNSKTIKLKFGGTTIITSDITNQSGLNLQRTISNRNSKTAQITLGDSSSSFAVTTVTTPALTMTENTANPLTIAVTGTNSNGGDSLTVEQFIIEHLP